MVDEKGICVDYIYLYHTFYKTLMIKEGKGPFLIEKNSDYK